MTPKGRHPVYGFIYTPINQFFLEEQAMKTTSPFLVR